MKKKLLSLLLLGGLTLTAGAQQLPNGGFEGSWSTCSPYTGGKTTSVGTQPSSWTAANVAGFFLGIGSFGTWSGSTQVVEQVSGKTGSYAAQLTNSPNSVVSSQTVPGYMALGSQTTWNTANTSASADSKDGGSFGSYGFTYKPDAIKLFYKRNVTDAEAAKSEKDRVPATVVAYLWKGTSTQTNVPVSIGSKPTKVTMTDRDRNVLGMEYAKGDAPTYSSDFKRIAKVIHYIYDNPSEWTELVVPFEYEDLNATPQKIQVILAANSYFDASNIVQNNSFTVDDVTMVYYSTLKTLSYNGVAQTIPEVGGTLDMSSVEYDASKLSCTLNGQTATAQHSYDEATCKLTITVSNVDADVDGQSSHTYYVQFATPQSEPEIVSSTDYSDNLVVVINGENTLPQETTIKVSKMSDGSYTLSLNDFMLVAGEEILPVGNIVLEGLTATEENGTISFSTNQAILIQPGSTGSAEDWAGPMLGEVPIVMTAKVSGGKMKCEIDIDMTVMLGQVINVYFGVVNNLETEALPDAEGVHVVLSRTFQPGWSTLYLQYDVTKEELGAVKVMELDVYDEKSQALVFREVVGDDISGNYPYLVKFDSEKANPFFANRSVWSSGGSRTCDSWLFTGTFTGIAAPGMEGKYGVTADADGYQYIRRGGKNASIKGTRAFFEYYGEDQGVQQMRIRIEGEDGVTSIDGVETVIGSFDIYNLQGIRVRTAATSLEGLTPGVYVVNGKKVLVK